jgi:hypothetical protein
MVILSDEGFGVAGGVKEMVIGMGAAGGWRAGLDRLVDDRECRGLGIDSTLDSSSLWTVVRWGSREGMED